MAKKTVSFTHNRIEKYFSRHVTFNAVIHAVGGLGVGILVHSYFNPHPVRYGLLLLGIALLGHLYAYRKSK